jgi:hypothetical protein
MKVQSPWAGVVAQAVQFLPSKCEALSSNSSTTKKKVLKDDFSFFHSLPLVMVFFIFYLMF